MSQRMTCYTRWSFNYPPGTGDPGRIRIRHQLCPVRNRLTVRICARLAGTGGSVGTGRLPDKEVQIPEETQPWFCSQETRPLLIMTEHGLGLLSKRYLPACGLGLLIHFHVPGKRGAAAVNRGLLQTDWIVSESVRAMGAGRCDAETYQVLTEAAYELSERLPALFPTAGQADRASAGRVRLHLQHGGGNRLCRAGGADPRRRHGSGSEPAGFLLPPARLGGVPAVRTVAGMAHGGGRRKPGPSRSTPRAPTTETLSVRLDMELEYVRSAARAVCASSGVLNGDSGAFLTGYHCLTHASAYNGAILRYDLGNPVPAPDNRRLERHLTLEMTMLNDPAVDSQMNLRSARPNCSGSDRSRPVDRFFRCPHAAVRAGRHPVFGHPSRTAHTFAPCVNDW